MNLFRKGISNAGYFVGNFLEYSLIPKWIFRYKLEHLLNDLSEREQQLVSKRVDYYNKLQSYTPIFNGQRVGDYHFPYKKISYEGKERRFAAYFFDQHEVMRYFPLSYQFHYIHGDVRSVPHQPTFVKSRPIEGDNTNSVLLKLNKRRHYHFVEDPMSFDEKKGMLVSRTTWCNARPWRRKFCEMFWNHPLCDVGKTKAEPDEDFPESIKEYMSIADQLKYKFIACVEGIDVATNLKWVMSSNSIAVSPPMKYETWFMEGKLIPDYHYIGVLPDYSDLVDKLNFYIAHPQEAQKIIEHAHEHVYQFKDNRLEMVTQLAVAQKYFQKTMLK
ncbi:MAG: glycosyltransferase family 1 protein [Bacteroidaceae bacterium]|nr:glycosyltransferase family 1 protein [Bacteroidaceae bacterium]